jgi:hypothetical protein
MQNKDIISLLYEQKHLQHNKIEDAIQKSVLKKAEENYRFLSKISHYNFAEDMMSPEYLAYAMIIGNFSRRQIKKIPFRKDNGEWEFQKSYGRLRLIDNLVERLINPKPVGISRRLKCYEIEESCLNEGC